MGTTQSSEIPEEGELVISTVEQITNHGVYVNLGEYGKMRAFLHVSEIAQGWVRNIDRFVQVGQKIVLKVIHISKARNEVDLSLKQVSGEERKAKLIEVKRSEKARGIFEIIDQKLNVAKEESAKYKAVLGDEFGGLYDALETVLRKGGQVLSELELPAQYVEALEAAAKDKLVVPTVSVGGIIEAISKSPDGINIIRKSLSTAESVKAGGSTVTVTYIGAPKYRISVEAETYKIAEKALDAAVQKATDAIEKYKGSLIFNRGKIKGRASE